MPDISIADGVSLSVAGDLFNDASIGKSVPAALHFVKSDVLGALDQPLDKASVSSLALGFSFEPSFTLAGGTARLKAGGSLGGEVDLYRPDPHGKPAVLFDADHYAGEINTGTDCYLALAFQFALQGAASAAPGNYTLELEASATPSAKLYLPFAAAGNAFPTLKEALAQLFAAYSLPASFDDAARLPLHAGFVFETRGAARFEGKFDLLATVNPTATPGICPSLGPLTLKAGPSLTIGGNLALSGDFQVRIWKTGPATLQIGYYKKRGSSLSVKLSGGAGIDAEVSGLDIIAELYSLLGDSGKLDAAWVKANVPQSVADQVKDAYHAAVQTSLSISFAAQLDTSDTDQAAFVWNLDLSTCAADAHQAVASALNGDLSVLLGSATLPAGITRAGSVLDHLRDTKATLTLNLLGLLDHASVSEFVTRSNARVSEDGQLVLTDTEHLTRLEATTTPLVKTDQLRRVFAEDCVATVGYAASAAQGNPQLKVVYSTCFYKDRLSVTDLLSWVNTTASLAGPSVLSDWDSKLHAPLPPVAGSFLASLSYDPATAAHLFLDSTGAPRTIPDFEKAARTATTLTPGEIAEDRFRAILASDPGWQQIRDSGTAQHFEEIIGVSTTSPPDWAPVAFAQTLHIVNWAAAMHSAAQALQSVLSYASGKPADALLHDAAYTQRRQAFATQLKKAIEETPLFHDVLGLLLIYTAAKPAVKSIAIRCGGISKEYA